MWRMEYALWISGCLWPGYSIPPIAGLIFCLQVRLFAHFAGHRKGSADMTYIENVFLCMASPLLILLLCVWGGGRENSFCSALPGWVSVYFRITSTPFSAHFIKRTPLLTFYRVPSGGGVMKLLPLLFYLLMLSQAEQIKNLSP